MCADTVAERCLKGTYSNRDDIPLENGACGSSLNNCDRGDYADRADTDSEYLWGCVGIDAEDRWACLGVAGSKNWSCSYGDQSKACGVPVPAKESKPCGVVTRAASDRDCSICKPGYTRYNGACKPPECGDEEDECKVGDWAERADTLGPPATNRWYCRAAGESESCRDPAPPPNCGANEEYALDASKELTCVCEAGHVRHSGACKEPPACGDEEDECKVGDWAEQADTLDPATNRWYCQAAGESESCRDPAPPPNCGANEEYALDASDELTCVCEAGYHRDEDGICVEDPYCPKPLTENACGPDTATLTDLPDTVVYGVCAKTEAAQCVTGAFTDQSDIAPRHGACGTDANSCDFGNAVKKEETNSTYTWNCTGIAGARKWQCTGMDGDLNWQCAHGKQTESCQLEASGKTKNCGVTKLDPIPANDDLGCSACKPGYAPNENGKCVCKPGHQKIGGVCKKAIVKLTVSPPTLTSSSAADPLPVVCNITAPAVVDGAQDILCGYGGTSCEAYYEKGKQVTLTNTAKSGYRHEKWTGACSGASATCTLTMNAAKSVSADCETTLSLDHGGPYTAKYFYVPLPPPLPPSSFYSASVEASASGGVPAYKFKWKGKPVGAKAVYIYPVLTASGKKERVDLTDGAKNTDFAETKINLPSSDAVQGASDAAAAFEVPLGGELHFVWGGEGEVTARSADLAVVTASVSSPAIRVAGAGAGETHVVLRDADGEDYYLPVVVR